MKLTDLIDALADEVDIMQPDLAEMLDELSVADVASDTFVDVLDQYNDNVQRMGEASEMVGFTGLQIICQQVQNNSLLLLSASNHERSEVLAFLRKWPALMSSFLRDLSDPSLAAGLVDVFLSAPVPFAEDEALKVMHQLGAMTLQANEGAQIDGTAEQRQKVALAEDVELDVPEDVNQQLLEGFLQESPDMALSLVVWAQDVVSGAEVEADEVKTAKRYVHTLKGTGATIGIRGLASLGHHFEDILEYLETHPKNISLTIQNILLDAAYCMEQMVGYVAGLDDYPTQAQSVLQQILDIANHIDQGHELHEMVMTSHAHVSDDNTQQTATSTPLTIDEQVISDIFDEQILPPQEPVTQPVNQTHSTQNVSGQNTSAKSQSTEQTVNKPVINSAINIVEDAHVVNVRDTHTGDNANDALKTTAPQPQQHQNNPQSTETKAASTFKSNSSPQFQPQVQSTPQPLVAATANQMAKQKPSKQTNKEVSKPQKNTAKNKQASLRVPLDKIDQLFLVSGEISVHSSAMEANIKAIADEAKALLEQNIRVQKRLFELETLVDVRALSMMRGRIESGEHQADDFDPLEMDQYNELHSSAHALVEEAADARAIAHKIEDGLASLASLQNRQDVLSRDLQHVVIGTRMAEVAGIESRLQRNVRMTSQSTGKLASLTMTGKDTLIDSDVLNRLAEPLLHLLRNAVDHGIEPPEERVAKGKAAAGKIRLDFLRQGQQVILRCHDDGKGLDFAKIRKRAIANNLITDTQELSSDEVARLIFMSGFSSQDKVSEISGRGVGLDVVREWVNAMKGTITVSESQYGGCLFELKFAASLSTIQSLVVEVADALYALPAVQIEQAVPRSVGRFAYLNNQLQFYYNKTAMPARFLAHMTGMAIDEDKPLDEYDAVIVVLNNQRYALAVDQLIDSRELLVKKPGRYAQHLLGISGLSILGNGDIVVNLDLPQLIDNQSGQKAIKTSAAKRAVANVPSILVVDDALTVRNSLQQLIQDMGYQVKTARDGLDAIKVMESFQPRVLLTDLEMPNLNGIELTQHIRSRQDIAKLPIVMITSRSQDKHRQLAKQAGVDLYITKPYQDMELIKVIQQYAG